MTLPSRWVAVAAFACTASAGFAATPAGYGDLTAATPFMVYSNSSIYVPNVTLSTANWVADQVVMDPATGSHIGNNFMSYFGIQYIAYNTTLGLGSNPQGTLRVQLNLYKNDGAQDHWGDPNVLRPSTPLFSEDVSGIAGSLLASDGNYKLEFSAAGGDFSLGDITIPAEGFTFALKVTSSDPTDYIGVYLAGSPTDIGADYQYFWQFAPPGYTDWESWTNAGYANNNFGVAVEAVPEPATLWLLGLGGLLSLGFARRWAGRK